MDKKKLTTATWKMTIHQKHAVALFTFPDASVESEEFGFLDFSTSDPGSNEGSEINGPRVSFRRIWTGLRPGWRIILHADSGDPISGIDIHDTDLEGYPRTVSLGKM